MCWHTPVITATWEAETGESLEPGRQRLCELRLRHCTLVWRLATEGDSVSKNKTKKETEAQRGPQGHDAIEWQVGTYYCLMFFLVFHSPRSVQMNV